MRRLVSVDDPPFGAGVPGPRCAWQVFERRRERRRGRVRGAVGCEVGGGGTSVPTSLARRRVGPEMVKKRRWVDSATLVAVCPHTRGSGWAPNWPLPLGAQGHPEPQPGAPRGGGGEDPTKGTLRPCCGTLPSGGRVSAVGSPERATPCAARSTRKARRAAGPATRALAPPVGPGEALASAVPTRVALLTRVAMPTLVANHARRSTGG